MGKYTVTYLQNEDIAEVADFLGLDFEYCKQRILNYDVMEMAEAWHKANPKTPKEISKFYSDSNLYIFELTKTGASAERMAFHGKVIDYLLKNYAHATHPKVLDFGAGVGTDLIRFSKGGYDISFADIPGKTTDFIQYRFARRNIKSTFIPITGKKIYLRERYDIIICFDVLEHVSDPLTTLSTLTRHLKKSGVIAIINCPDDQGGAAPCHLPQTFLPLKELWFLTLDYAGLTEIPGVKHVYRKVPFVRSLLKKLRYYIWKLTSFYIARLSIKEDIYDV